MTAAKTRTARVLKVRWVVMVMVASMTVLAAVLIVLPSRSFADTTATLFAPGAAPTIADWPDGSAVEVGVRFESDVPGSITALRFYKSRENTGRHVGNLWTADGTNVARAVFVGESSTGWQQVDFPNPVPIQAGTVYVASYHTDAGHYAADHGGFATQLDSPPLHAPADGDGGPNGVFAYGDDSTFPSNGWIGTNYWVDVVFSAATGVPTTTTVAAPTTTTTTPTSTTTTTLAPPATTSTTGVPRTTTTTAAQPTTTTTAPSTTTTTSPPPSSGMPNATNTGVPAGTTLRAMSSSSCQWVVTQDNTVVDGVDLAGCIDVEANNVTIQNSRITSNTWWGIKYGASKPNITGLRVLHDTIQSVPGQGPDAGGYDYGISELGNGTMEVGYSNISGFKDGVDIDTGSLHDNYIHDLSQFSGAHTQDVYVWCGGEGIILQHNTLINQTAVAFSTAAVYIAPDCGHQDDVLVTGNLLAGGALTVYGGDSTAANIRVVNNLFSTQIYSDSGFYGPVGYWWSANSGNVWSGNVWADGPNAGNSISP